ncbi:APC family permease [Alicyclobacillus tolerans]|uniref:APC family permease n=1 Tax=Alicyclobacillus tolerans TaxID=90970 RepID=UPI003B810ABC
MSQPLHKNGLSLLETMAISVAIMAPTAAMALNGSLAASIAGVSVPLTFLLAMVTIGLVAFAFVQFNRHFSSSGSVYAFTTASLGPRAGFLSGWALLLTYLAFTGASGAEVGAFLQSFLGILNMHISWVPLAVVATLLIWLLAFLEVRISARVMLVFEGISMLLILILTVVILGRGGAAGHLSALPFTLGGNRFSAIGLASVFAFLSFAGFEGASSLGEETANAKRAIPMAIASAVFVTGIFYVLVSYAQSLGFGLTAAGVKTFANSSAPLGYLAQHYMSSGFAAAIMFGAAMSAFSSGLGTATTGSRLLYSMGRDGFLNSKLGDVHKRFRSPYVALAVVMVIALLEMLALAKQTGTNVFGYYGTLGVLSLLLAYLATNIGAIFYFTRKRIWRSGILVVPALAVLALAYTLYSNLYPVPADPYNWFPYIVLAWLLLGVIVIWVSPQMVKTIARRLAEESDISL